MMNHEMYSSQIDNRSIVTEQKASHKCQTLHSSVYKFKDIENVIQLAHRLPQPFFNSKLVRYHHYYYLVIYFPESRMLRGKDWVESLILEYGDRCHVTIHRLKEYGKELISDNSMASIKAYFREIV